MIEIEDTSTDFDIESIKRACKMRWLHNGQPSQECSLTPDSSITGRHPAYRCSTCGTLVERD